MANYILGKKQIAKNEDWLLVKNHIEDYVSKDEITVKVKQAINLIKQQTKGKNAAFAWSGGKDSLPLQYVCEKAGIKQCVLAIASELEFPEFLKWVDENKPKGLTIIDNKKLTIDWLASHPEMLFPQAGNLNSRYYQMIQHKAQDDYYKAKNLDLLILGRRLQDGNYIGNSTNFIYKNGKGTTRFSPLADWKHEDIFACIHYFCNDNYPPNYEYPNGFIRGSGVWSERRSWCKSIEECLDEIYNADKSVLVKAASKIEIIDNFLKSKKNGKNSKNRKENRKGS